MWKLQVCTTRWFERDVFDVYKGKHDQGCMVLVLNNHVLYVPPVLEFAQT